MHILCLHGMGTSNKVFEMQTAALRHELGEPHLHSFEFVEGSLTWAPAPGIQDLFPNTFEYFSYYDPDDASSVLTAINDLAEYVAMAKPPFDGVIGFSQGAALAAMLLVRNHRRVEKPCFNFAVFICAGVPLDEETLLAGDLNYLDAALHGRVVCVPTANIYGSKDELVENAVKLRELCQDRGKVLYDHGGGHDIPRTPKEVTTQIAHVVTEVIRRAALIQ